MAQHPVNTPELGAGSTDNLAGDADSSIALASEAQEQAELFQPSPPPNIDTATLPPPPQTIEEIRAALTKREQQISAIPSSGGSSGSVK